MERDLTFEKPLSHRKEGILREANILQTYVSVEFLTPYIDLKLKRISVGSV